MRLGIAWRSVQTDSSVGPTSKDGVTRCRLRRATPCRVVIVRTYCTIIRSSRQGEPMSEMRPQHEPAPRVEEVGIHVECRCRFGMTESAAHSSDRDACCQQLRRMQMTQVVQANARQPSPLTDPAKVPRHGVRMKRQRPVGFGGEHETLRIELESADDGESFHTGAWIAHRDPMLNRVMRATSEFAGRSITIRQRECFQDFHDLLVRLQLVPSGRLACLATPVEPGGTPPERMRAAAGNFQRGQNH